MIDIGPLLPPLRDRDLINCPACNKLFLAQEMACRHCHAQVDDNIRMLRLARRRQSERRGMFVAFILLAILVALFSVIGPDGR